MKALPNCWVIVALILQPVISECPVCDPNDYEPVCAAGKAFRSICHLVRQKCLGKVEISSNFFGKCGQKLFVPLSGNPDISETAVPEMISSRMMSVNKPERIRRPEARRSFAARMEMPVPPRTEIPFPARIDVPSDSVVVQFDRGMEIPLPLECVKNLDSATLQILKFLLQRMMSLTQTLN